jgi:hypothetical protein
MKDAASHYLHCAMLRRLADPHYSLAIRRAVGIDAVGVVIDPDRLARQGGQGLRHRYRSRKQNARGSHHYARQNTHWKSLSD